MSASSSLFRKTFLVLALAAASSAGAQGIRTDASWGRTPQTLAGPVYRIPEALGRVSGNNLFHSFERFGLSGRETAQFSTVSADLRAVLARVTGGEPSLIRGTIQLVPAAGSRPDLILVNPAGIAFAGSARVDVPAAFHAGTASEVRFADGMRWPTGSADSTLSAAPPTAFGFVGGPTGDLGIADGARLEVDAGMTLAAANLVVSGAETRARSGTGDLIAVAMGSAAGAVPLVDAAAAGGSPALPAGSGRIEIRRGGEIGSLGQGGHGGNVSLRSGTLQMSGLNSGLGSVTLGAGDAGTVRIEAGEGIDLADQATIASSTLAAGNSGLLSIAAGRLTLDHAIVTTAALPGSSGHAGTVQVDAGGAVVLRDRSRFDSSTFGPGNAGAVSVHAGDIALDGSGTVIDSSGRAGASGNAGPVSVRAERTLSLSDGSQIGSNAYASGDAGVVDVRAGAMTIRGGFSGVVSQAQPGSTGHAGSVGVAVAGVLEMTAGGKISSSTYGSGNAGVVAVGAGEIRIGGSGSAGPSSIESVSLPVPSGPGGHAGGVSVTVSGLLDLSDGALIDSSTYTTGNAGSLAVAARELRLSGNSGITSSAYPENGGSAGNIDVRATGSLVLSDNALIAASTFSRNDAGSIVVRAGDMSLDHANISSTSASATAGNAGTVRIEAGTLALRDGHIATSTQSAGNSGEIELAVGRLTIDHGSLQNQGNPGSSGRAGPIRIGADDIELRNGALVVSAAFGSGDAGGILIDARRLLIDGPNTGLYGSTGPRSSGNGGGIIANIAGTLELRGGGTIDSSTLGSGDAGLIAIRAGALTISGESKITSVSVNPNSGDAGAIDIDVRDTLVLTDGAGISSNTYSAGDAGLIRLRADSIVLDGALIDSQTGEGSRGGGGLIDLAGGRSVVLRNRSVVSTSTFGEGDAGGAQIVAPRIALDDSFIVSAASETASGDAGVVRVVAGESLTLTGGSGITGATRSPVGAAGTVEVVAGNIAVSGGGITSDARAGSSGRVGTVSVTAGDIALDGGGRISITNQSTAPQPDSLGSLTVAARNLVLQGGASISAASDHDIAASDIRVSVGDRLLLDRSSITTSANNGNGGAITIGRPKLALLRNSLITTSVSGSAGDGGNISLAAGSLILDTGFVQANTAADNASGGTVNIDVERLLPSGNSLRVGGDTALVFFPGVFGANVIQAAAPDGLSGTIEISSPPTDISGALVGLAAPPLDLGAFGRDPCNRRAGSSLTLPGRGALPAGPAGFVRPAASHARAAAPAMALAGNPDCLR